MLETESNQSGVDEAWRGRVVDGRFGADPAREAQGLGLGALQSPRRIYLGGFSIF